MISFSTDHAQFSASRITAAAKRTRAQIKRLSDVRAGSPDASILLPSDEHVLTVVRAAAALKKKLHPELIVLIGIGGSNLGAMAVAEAVLGKDWNLHHTPRLLCADTIDPDKIAGVIRAMQEVLRQGKNVILNVVSKSGGTAETIANFEILLNVLRRHRKDAQQCVVVTTDKGSKLWTLAERSGFSLLEIPQEVGGRYSVFSSVGLFPLALLGIDIQALREGACEMRDQCLSLNMQKNPAARGAGVLLLHAQSGINIYDQFFFSTDLESLGKWCRQLLAESCGKAFTRKGKRVRFALTPTVSIGTTDLHSMAQLYLAGPTDKLTNVVTTHFSNTITIPFYPEYNALVPNLQKRELNQVMKLIASSVKTAYRKAKRPYTETKLSGNNAESIGAFMQWKMIETMLFAFLLDVNAFDQPAVELYKKEVRRALG